MTLPETIIKLCDNFDFHRGAYLKSTRDYNEAKLRADFLDPFFKELGWDVDNKKSYSEKYREVGHEQTIKIQGKTEFIDYTFRIGGITKFIVEAKAPSVEIKSNRDAALQVRRYAWNARIPLCILTNFEEFAIYDCTKKPSKSDTAAYARDYYFTYKDYPEKWETITKIFSQEAILKGSFDKYIVAAKEKSGTASVDESFLIDIENWREELAKNIELRNRNPPLSIEELNFSVQTILDRIIFLRICEDRGIEKFGSLRSFVDGENIYQHLCDFFKNADKKYNSGLFHFYDEPDRESPDVFTPSLNIDDKVFKNIIKGLYPPDSPYEFYVIPPEILGQVYEQFLGEVIRLTEKFQVKIEEKQKVKKSGGIYYTPPYIVEYIIKTTLDDILKDKNRGNVSEIKILDPACGSGSFLLGAYQYLLNWHLEWYLKNLVPLLNPPLDKESKPISHPDIQKLLPEYPPDGNKEVPIYNAGYNKAIHTKMGDRRRSDWKLTTSERKRILLNNIFGVDIDRQAVEVTKLSLLLKVLEEENEETIKIQFEQGNQRALPSLHKNIKCGNSLVGWDVLELDLPQEGIKKINPFDWDKEYGKVMEEGGFDAVIGNPPYVKLHNIDKNSLQYYFKRYQTAEKKCDIYAFFTEKVLFHLLKKNGSLGYIISDSWLNLDSFTNMRKIVIKDNQLLQICTLENPFQKVSVSPIMFFVRKNIEESYDFQISHYDIKTQQKTLDRAVSSLWIEPPDYIFDLTITPESYALKQKIQKSGIPLASVADLQYGIMTANNEKFVISKAEKPFHKPLLSGEDIARYQINWPGNRFIDYRPAEMKKKDTARPGEPERFERDEKIVFQRYSSTQIIAALDTSKFYTLGTTIIAHSISGYCNKYLLGLVNSSLLTWWYGRAYTTPTNYIREFEALPIRPIDFSNPIDTSKHDSVVKLVDQLSALIKNLHETKLEQDRILLARQIDAIDTQINSFVYELYGLSAEEITIVERG